jgi:hypothetical protein
MKVLSLMEVRLFISIGAMALDYLDVLASFDIFMI